MIYSIIDREFLLKKYVDARATDKQLANEIGCCVSTIVYYRRKYGIPANKHLQGKDLVGEKFERLLVICENERKKKRIYWLCKCDCGNKVIVNTHDLTSENTRSCGCIKSEMVKEKHQNWTGYKQITGHRWGHMKQSAKNRGIEWSLTIEDAYSVMEKQNFLCALSSIPLDLETTASIDRIDSLLGYRLDNIEWVHKDINRMKWDYTKNYFINLCKMVIYKCEDAETTEIYSDRGIKWKGFGNISGDFWCDIKNNAKIRSLSVDLSIQNAWDLYVNQNGKCAISGVPIRFQNKGEPDTSTTASLDRKSSHLGYTTENCWWVHKHINNIKWKHDLDYFTYLCKCITETQKVICV